MAESTSTKKISERDKLITRPSAEPLPTVKDPSEPRGEPADPETEPKKTNKGNAVEYTA